MSAKKGSLVLIKIGNGGIPEIFTTVGGLRTSRIAINSQLLNTTNIESSAWRQLLNSAGQRSVSINGSGAFTDAASEEILRSKAFSGSIANYQFVFSNGDYITGPFLVGFYERSGDYDAEETFSITLESAGNVVFTAV